MKIILGTVQFGVSYGVSNTSGKTTIQEASDILNYAWKNEINTIDTASNYGNSESVIGELTGKNKWNIITKTPSLDNCIDIRDCIKSIDISLEKSLHYLGVGSVSALLIHSANDLLDSKGFQLFNHMKHLKDMGLVEKIGVSVYAYDQIDYILGNYEVDIIQLPVNILDQRLIESGHLAKIKQYGVEIHARSVFLQGLLLMPLCKLPNHFSKVSDSINRFLMHSHERSLSSVELALGFVQDIQEIDKVVVGANTVNQLIEIIDASNVKVNYKEYTDLSLSDPYYLNPSNWKL
jgi:aryl-alcohol dehydrogenase-like predicted oxidoreductase